MKQEYHTFVGPITLDHQLSPCEGEGKYENIIACQSNGAGTKKLLIVNDISILSCNSYFVIKKNNVIVDVAMTLEKARHIYNNVN